MNEPFIEHVHELRSRLMWTAVVLAAGAGVAYVFHNGILGWLQAPLQTTLYFTNVTGAFDFLMQACLLAGLLVAIPVLVYNLVSFVSPALPAPVSRWRVVGLVVASGGLAVGGVAFAYYVTLPLVLRFFRTVDVTHLHPLIAAGSYLGFVITYLGVFAAVFQLPLIMLFIDRITPIPPTALRKWRRWVVIGAFGAALILPIAPDPVSQMMLALPVVVLYELSLWLVILAHRRQRRRAAKAEVVPEGPSQERLPMAIAVPNQPAPEFRAVPNRSAGTTGPARRAVSMDGVGARRSVIDLRGL